MRDAYTRSRFVPLQVTGSKPTKSSKLSFDPQVTGSKPMKSLFKTALKHRSRRRIYIISYEPSGKENPRVVMPRWHLSSSFYGDILYGAPVMEKRAGNALSKTCVSKTRKLPAHTF